MPGGLSAHPQPDDSVSALRHRALELVRQEPRGEETDAAAALERLCRAVTKELGLAGAAVTLFPELGSHSVAAVSSAAIRTVEELQFDAGEGPTRDSYHGYRPVIAADLEACVERWPGYAPAGLQSGVGAVFSMPLHVGAARLGALTMYWPRTQHPEGSDLRVALGFADIATEILLDASYASATEDVDPGLYGALGTHEHIYQAQGAVMVDLRVGLPQALARMRAYAYAADQSLTVLASDILDGTTVLERDPATSI